MLKEKASDIILKKMIAEGPEVVVYTLQGKPCKCKYTRDKKCFVCDKLPTSTKFYFDIFDLIVSALEENGGQMDKGNARNSRLGEGKCGFDTVAGVVGRDYFGNSKGDSVYDPIFVLASILEWAGICDNERGYIKLR